MTTLISRMYSMQSKIVSPWFAFLLILGTSLSQAAETVVYDPGLLVFGTSDQSMWESGAGIVPQEVNYSTSWSADDNRVSLGEITGVESYQVPGTGGSIPNPELAIYNTALSACTGLGYSSSQCKNGTGAIYAPCLLRNADGDCILGGGKILDGIPGLGSAPSSAIPNPIPAQFIDTRTGFEGGLSTSGSIGIFSDFGANGGTVDADFEYSVSLSYPNQVVAGEFFSLNPVSSLNDKDMTTFFPQLTGTVTSRFETKITGFSKVCGIFNEGGTGCTTTSADWVNVDIDPEILEMNTANLPPDTASFFDLDDLAFDATRIRVFLDFGETGPTLSLPGFPRPLLAINVGDLTLDAPSTDLGNSASFENGKLTSSSHLTNVVALNVDNDARATMAGLLPPFGAVSNIGPLTFRGDVIDIGYGMTIDMNQDFELTPTLMVRLDFNGPVLARDYEQPGIRPVTSITSPFGQLPDIALIDGQKVHVTPTFFMQAEFDNNSEMIFNLTVFRDILNGSITMLGLDLAADCISCGQENLAEFGSIELFDDSFDLGGFNDIQGQPFVLVTNNPPELKNVPGDTNIEGNVTGGASSDHESIVTFLNQVTATDEEDDDASLVVTTSPSLPELLTLASTTTVIFSVTDSFGDTTTEEATLTIVDTTPPVLSLGDLTTVAEGPLGSPLPDAAMTVSNWLSELVVQDIVDPSPVIDSQVPTFLDLGTTPIGFVATDSSGNQSSIDPMVYLKAPFSLFAQNSIRIDKRTVVESGVVAVPEFTAGPWLSKDAQVDIDKYSALDFAAPLYSDSINLDNKSWVASAFFNYRDGKGEIENEHPFLPGIYFPLEGLPGYVPGDMTIEVGCHKKKDKDDDDDDEDDKHEKNKGSSTDAAPVSCLESGMVLESGNYNKLNLNKGKHREATTLFLSGGVYSFSSISMEEYSSIIALDSSLILVAGTVETDKGASIVPVNQDGEEIEIIVMVDGTDVVNGRRDDEDDDEDDEDDDDDKGKDDHANQHKLKIKDFAVSFDRDNEIHATIFAPNGSIELGKRSVVEGALIGDNLDIGEEVIVRFNGDI